jgi:hypothetical protein
VPARLEGALLSLFMCQEGCRVVTRGGGATWHARPKNARLDLVERGVWTTVAAVPDSVTACSRPRSISVRR